MAWRAAVGITESYSARSADPGLEALVALLHLQGVSADAGQIRHRLGADKIGAPEMLRCAKDLGLKARTYRTDWSRLVRTPLPAIAALRDGGFVSVPAWPSTVSLPSPGFQMKVSLPLPSRAVSLPRPPVTVSLPSPPSRMSSP